MTQEDELNITGRDFGRLEGKVDAIAEDVGELKRNMLGTVDRVSAVERNYTVLKTSQETLRAVQTATVQKNEGKQMSLQTVIMFVAVVIAGISAVGATLMHFFG